MATVGRYGGEAVLEWRAHAIAETRARLDAHDLSDAAGRAAVPVRGSSRGKGATRRAKENIAVLTRCFDRGGLVRAPANDLRSHARTSPLFRADCVWSSSFPCRWLLEGSSRSCVAECVFCWRAAVER
jgi:hypothetical protein